MSLTLPCVTGPYLGVNATLTLQESSVRRTNLLSAGKHARTGPGDPRFKDLPGAQQSIATSSGQADAGLFELSFQDERFLPFENAGVISTWHLKLSPIPQFDYALISDVVMHLRYTAREGGLLKGTFHRIMW